MVVEKKRAGGHNRQSDGKLNKMRRNRRSCCTCFDRERDTFNDLELDQKRYIYSSSSTLKENAGIHTRIKYTGGYTQHSSSTTAVAVEQDSRGGPERERERVSSQKRAQHS